MKATNDVNLYEAPQMNIVELMLEHSILTNSGDPDITNPDMGWDD